MIQTAKKNINIVLKFKPTHPKANFEAALIYQADGENDKALTYLKQALNVWKYADPDFEPVIEARAKLLEFESI